MGIAMTLEDSWGGDIATAAIAHLAHSTPTEFPFSRGIQTPVRPICVFKDRRKRNQAMISWTTRPCTSVRRKSRPA